MIELRNISKHFGGVRALTDVSLRIDRGHVHGLMGENGAGKSTLGKVLSGIHTPDTGEILLDGKPHRFRSPADALAAGVGMVHQELAFCPDLSVAENLCMGHYPRRRGLVDRAAMRMRASQLLQEIGLSIDVDRPMRDLSTAQEQGVQIAAAVGTNARVIVFDEPTASLSARESEALFELIGKLKARGITLIYVSHRMPEVLALCDTISVLRDGAYVGELSRGQATHEKLVEMMTGRVINMDRTGGTRSPGPVRLAVRGLCSPGKFSDISFDVRAGEIVGVAGLVGAGRSEVACAIFGLDARASGKVLVDDKPLKLGSVTRSIGAGISLVPEDRKRQGLVLSMSVRHNTTLASLDLISTGPILNLARDVCTASDMVTRLGTKTASIDTPVRQLSGGNQQKVVLGKALMTGPTVVLLDEPTRGIDVGAKLEVYELINRLTAEGQAVILVSSELPELMGMSDRILMLADGRIGGEFARSDFSQEKLLAAAMGRRSAGAATANDQGPRTNVP